MSKKSLGEEQKVSDIAANEIQPETIVAKARKWALALWERAEKLEGQNRETAMHTAARWADVTPNTIWKLRYRVPRNLDVAVFFKLEAAHQRHITSVEAKVAENLIALRALPSTPSRDRLVADMEKYLGASEGAEAR